MDYVARLIELLVGAVIAFVAYWVRRLDKEQDVMRAELEELKAGGANRQGELKTIRELLEAHIDREENHLWKRLDEMNTQQETRHIEVIGRLVAVETMLSVRR